MKILVVCHRFPYPPKRGGKIRPFNIIQHLHRQGHEVHVASLTRSRAETAEIKGIRSHCTDYVFAQTNALSAFAQDAAVCTVHHAIIDGLLLFEASQAEHRPAAGGAAIRVYRRSLLISSAICEPCRKRPKDPDFGDMDSQKWLVYAQARKPPLSLGYWWEGKKLEREEKRLARSFDLCTCTTKAELETLRSYDAAQATGWFPNGVDTTYFKPGEQPYDPNLLSFIGRMDYYPNQQAMFNFCRDVLPEIQVKRPGVELQIVGAEPSKAVRKLSRLRGVTVTGSVDDVRPYVQKSAMTVAPLEIARGTQNKILESMAMGVPVVASVPASGGVDAVPGEHLLTASSPEEYCSAVLRLLDDPEARERFARAGLERVHLKHNWSESMARLDRLLDSCVKNHPHARGR